MPGKDHVPGDAEFTQTGRRAHAPDSFDAAVLHGRSRGCSLTLLNNVQTGSSTNRDLEHEEVHRQIAVGTVLIGDSHLNRDCRFNRASLRLSNLDEWVNRSPFQWTTGPDSVQVLNLPRLTASIPGCVITLGREVTSHHGRLTNSGFSSHEAIELRLAEAMTLDDLEYRLVRPLEQLLTLATGSHCEALALRVGNESPSDEELRWPFTSHSVRHRSSDQEQAEQHVVRPLMRFGMNGTGYRPDVDFGVVVPRWYALQEDLSSACDLIFSLYSDVGGYLQQQMFTAASAVEALHRGLNPLFELKSDSDRIRNRAVLAAVKARSPDHHEWLAGVLQYAHRRSYVFRLRELLRDTDHIMATIVGDEEKWAQQLRGIRDGIGHVLPSLDEGSVAEMIAMLYSARLFAEVVLLRQLGFDDRECRASVDRQGKREYLRAMMRTSFPRWFTGSSAGPGSG